jgi:hypothetical protein
MDLFVFGLVGGLLDTMREEHIMWWAWISEAAIGLCSMMWIVYGTACSLLGLSM